MKSLLLLLSVIALMVMIFLFSAQTGEKSGQLSGSIVRRILLLISGRETPDPQMQEKIYRLLSFLIRKAAHFTEYTLLGFTLLLYLHSRNTPLLWRRILPISIAIGIAYAATDEIHQLFVSGRGGSVRDVLIDSAGVICGTLLGMLLSKKQHR